jgi:hypothetical protein
VSKAALGLPRCNGHVCYPNTQRCGRIRSVPDCERILAAIEGRPAGDVRSLTGRPRRVPAARWPVAGAFRYWSGRRDHPHRVAARGSAYQP